MIILRINLKRDFITIEKSLEKENLNKIIIHNTSIRNIFSSIKTTSNKNIEEIEEIINKKTPIMTEKRIHKKWNIFYNHFNKSINDISKTKPKKIKEIIQLLNRLDQKTQKIFPTLRIYELENNDSFIKKINQETKRKDSYSAEIKNRGKYEKIKEYLPLIILFSSIFINYEKIILNIQKLYKLILPFLIKN